MVLMGGSGSGKTTLLNAIAGRGENMEVRYFTTEKARLSPNYTKLAFFSFSFSPPLFFFMEERANLMIDTWGSAN